MAEAQDRTEFDLAKLRAQLVECFSESELRDICFDLHVEYESLPGENKADKARELVAHLKRKRRIGELAAVCENRPASPALPEPPDIQQLPQSQLHRPLRPVVPNQAWPRIRVGIVALVLFAVLALLAIPALRPKPRVIVPAAPLASWLPSFCDATCGGANGPSFVDTRLVKGKTGDAIEVYFNVPSGGYSLITKKIDAKLLAGTQGLSFTYKGTGQPNTLEFKLMAKYPDDAGDTTYGVSWPGATDTQDAWTTMRVSYNDFTCWWPAENCAKHGNKPDLAAVLRMDFAVSNKANDKPGSGRVAFGDVIALQP